ncbi:hypothetical protein DP939_43015 [Spongiactinospora rosea]|uniref:DUF4192 domain-containing protein n=1 Tax=Spongiactinospora rosea TaxID=2248750 RepID=A0A366LJ92_9ACTN|nr:DUF4192 domain-containing protein [Spongiactinospora rosea]RBQ13958.1 hypothetical protein DP939_43015 [Spongiactinospora rosea]
MSEPNRVVRLQNAADLIAIVPYLLGFHPARSLVALTIIPQEENTPGYGGLRSVVWIDLPADRGNAPNVANRLTTLLAKEPLGYAVLIGYGSGSQVTPTMDAASGALTTAGFDLLEVLRCDEGRYWSYICTEPACCPPDGVPYDITASPAEAHAIMEGMVALPDRGAFDASLDWIDGPLREAMREATRTARDRAEMLLATKDGRFWWQEGTERISAALERTQDGDDLTPADLAWLGVLLTSRLIRDAAMTYLGKFPDRVHSRLWHLLTRMVEPEYAAAPATLLAYTAARRGELPLAHLATSRALSIDPDYRLATMIRYALTKGLTPPNFAAIDWGSRAEQMASEAEMNSPLSRPILPDGR